MTLTFETVDVETFPALDIAFEAGRMGGPRPAVLNAADEIAVAAFLQGRLGFLAISDVVDGTMNAVTWRELSTVDEVVEVDAEARAMAAGFVSRGCC